MSAGTHLAEAAQTKSYGYTCLKSILCAGLYLVCRLTQGETWPQAGEVVQQRLTSAQADAAAEALRARVAHFMAAQQAAGQPGPGSVPAAAETLPAGLANGAVAAPPAMQQLSPPPESNQLSSTTPGEPQSPRYRDPRTSLELGRSMSSTQTLLLGYPESMS